VFASGSGVTLSGGGMMLAVASAGYVGASIVGCALILGSRTAKLARISLSILLATLLVGLAIWLRGDAVGILSAVAWIGGLFLAIRKMPERWLPFASQFIGVQQCLMSFESLLVLLRLTRDGHIQNDAEIAAGLSAFPALGWAVTWSAISLLGMGFALRSVWLARPSSLAG
jgi:hypothetical protein